MWTYHFAWIDPDETFGDEHLVEDELIYDFSRDLAEGAIPSLTIEIRNPRVGLIGPSRKQWCFFSRSNGVTTQLLFKGRLVAIPANMIQETITIVFTAKPLDYVAQKQALAETLKVAPFYDPIFIDADKRDDPDSVMEGYPARWHVDPVTGEVTISDFISGEDGTVEFQQTDAYYDSVNFTPDTAPKTSFTVDASVNWKQSTTGTIDFGTQTVETYTGDGFLSDWPQAGTVLQSGWSVESALAEDLYGVRDTVTASWSYQWQNRAKTHVDGDTLSVNNSASMPVLLGPSLKQTLTISSNIIVGDPDTGTPASTSVSDNILYVPKWRIRTSMVLRYDAGQDRTEHLKFTLNSNLQPVVTDPDVAAASETITLNGSDVGIALEDDTIPIGDTARRAYFPIDRGQISVQYCLMVAAGHALFAARGSRAVWECPFDLAVDLTCRKNAVLHEPRMPGGIVAGKIIATSLKGNGDSGAFVGSVTIGSAIGYGEALEAVAGTPVYVEEGVLEPGIQAYTGQIVLVPNAVNVGYSPPIDADSQGPTFPLTMAQAVVSDVMHGTVEEQEAAIIASFQSEMILANTTSSASSQQQSIANQQKIALANQTSTSVALRDNPIWRELTLIPVSGDSFTNEYDLTVTTLSVPKQVDLEAA